MFVVTIIAFVLSNGLFGPRSVSFAATPPNVIFFMPDDMSFLFPEAPAANLDFFQGDASMFPHMYRVRDEGAVFKAAYVAGPKCAPSRFSVLTGRYCSKGIWARSTATSDVGGQKRFSINVPQCRLTGPDEFNNLQTVLASNGYATIHSGKWHLSPPSVADFTSEYSQSVAAVNGTGFNDVAAVYVGNMDSSNNYTHNLEWMTATALDKVEKAVNRDQPFFMYFTPTTPHSPSSRDAIESPLKSTPAGWLDSDPVSGMPDRSTLNSRRVVGYRDESIGTAWTDDSLGAIIAKLEALNVYDNTIIIVMMDHGQVAKDTLYEGGVRVALFARGPNIIPGLNISHKVTNLDILPTILEATGIETPGFEIDGLSWWSSVTASGPSQDILNRNCVIAESDRDRMVVCDDMKYIHIGTPAGGTSVFPSWDETHQLYNISSDEIENVNLANLSDYQDTLNFLKGLIIAHDEATDPIQCDPCGGDASYLETISHFNGFEKRTIYSSGCPNHYSYCTGKSLSDGCGGRGVEGTDTQAAEQGTIVEMPARPVIAVSATDTTCSLGSLGVALNGAGIFGGAVDQTCDYIDVDDENSEWVSFDICSGHSAGDFYHYHFPPSCLLTQALLASSVSLNGHSPQVGWALDGFPIYGPNGPGGVAMAHASQGCVGPVCLDECGGLLMELPDLDHFIYRYYMTGVISDLTTLPGDPKPAATDYPFALKCQRGCTWSQISGGSCANATSGVTSEYEAKPLDGYSTKFTNTSTSKKCGTGIVEISVAPTISPSVHPTLNFTYSPTSAPTTPVFSLATRECQQLIIPMYIYPGTEWEIVAGVDEGGIIIMNPNSGPGDSVNVDYILAVTNARAAGFLVLGYVHTSYGARNSSTVKAEVDLYESFYKIDGIFFDEVSTSANDIPYFADVSDYVYGVNGSYVVVLNPGTVPDEGYMRVADIIMTFEQTYLYYNESYFAPSYADNYPASKFAHLVHSTPPADWRSALEMSFERNARYVFITDDVMPNPWDTLPPYVTSEASASAQNCGNCNTEVVSNAIEWLRRQEGESGFLQSFDAPEGATWATNRAYSYDQAVAVIAFLLNADTAGSTLLNDARAILHALANNISPDPEDTTSLQVPFSWNTVTLESSSPYRSGASAWVAEAFGLYQLLTGDTTYEHILIGISNFLQNRLNASGADNCVTGGPDVSWCSTEHNIDSYFALKLTAYLTDDASYDISADVIASSLGSTLWNAVQGRFKQGIGDNYRALDCQSWGSIWLVTDHNQSINVNNRLEKALLFAENTFGNNQRSHLTNEWTEGYGPYADSSNGLQANCVWSEGTLGVAMAYLRAGQSTKTRRLVHNMSPITNTEGGLLYAAQETVVDNSGAVFYPYPSVAGSGWLALVCAAKQEVFWAKSTSILKSNEFSLNSLANIVTGTPSTVPSASPTTEMPTTMPSPVPSVIPSGCAQDNYYRGISYLLPGQKPVNKEEWNDLLQQLHELLIKTHVVLPYTSTGMDVWDALGILDMNPANESEVMLTYSNISMPWYVHGAVTGWNREHIWPRSYGLFDNGADYSDLHNLRAVDSNVNSARNNLYYDDCYPNVDPSCTQPAHADAASDTAKNAFKFMPSEHEKGDLARSAFYSALRYNGSFGATSEENTEQLTLSDCSCVGRQSFGNLSTLLRWHKNDAVDAAELNRNNRTCFIFQVKNSSIYYHINFKPLLYYITEEQKSFC